MGRNGEEWGGMRSNEKEGEGMRRWKKNKEVGTRMNEEAGRGIRRWRNEEVGRGMRMNEEAEGGMRMLKTGGGLVFHK